MMIESLQRSPSASQVQQSPHFLHWTGKLRNTLSHRKVPACHGEWVHEATTGHQRKDSSPRSHPQNAITSQMGKWRCEQGREQWQTFLSKQKKKGGGVRGMKAVHFLGSLFSALERNLLCGSHGSPRKMKALKTKMMWIVRVLSGCFMAPWTRTPLLDWAHPAHMGLT